MLEELRDTLSRQNISVHAYVLMPSHLHALLGFHRIEQLSRVMQSVKGLTSRRMKAVLSDDLVNGFSRTGKFVFWKRRFDDLVIWSEKQFMIKAKYIHNNPVKAELVNNAEDYKYSSARDWQLGEPGRIPIDKSWKWQGKEAN